jgi:hypothetical protein
MLEGDSFELDILQFHLKSIEVRYTLLGFGKTIADAVSPLRQIKTACSLIAHDCFICFRVLNYRWRWCFEILS